MANTLALAFGDNLKISRSHVGSMTGAESPEQSPSPAMDTPHSPPADASHEHLELDQEGVDYIIELQENLDSLSDDDPTRPMQLFLLGCAIADHHVKASLPGLGDMPKAITLLEEAIATTPSDHNARRSFSNALQNIHFHIYQSTRDKAHLDECIKYGRLAVGPKFPMDLEDPHTLLSQKYALSLARDLKEKFQMARGKEGRIKDLDEAVSLLTPAISGEISTDHDIRVGELCS
jgi:hypothetical protein